MRKENIVRSRMFMISKSSVKGYIQNVSLFIFTHIAELGRSTMKYKQMKTKRMNTKTNNCSSC